MNMNKWSIPKLRTTKEESGSPESPEQETHLMENSKPIDSKLLSLQTELTKLVAERVRIMSEDELLRTISDTKHALDEHAASCELEQIAATLARITTQYPKTNASESARRALKELQRSTATASSHSSIPKAA